MNNSEIDTEYCNEELARIVSNTTMWFIFYSFGGKADSLSYPAIAFLSACDDHRDQDDQHHDQDDQDHDPDHSDVAQTAGPPPPILLNNI